MFFSDYILTQDESLWILFCSTVQFHFTTNLSISLKSFGGIIFNGNMALGVGAAIRLVIFGFLGTIVI